MKKQTMEQLDQINLSTVLEKISLGSLMRGVIFLTKLVEPIKKCIVGTANKVKKVVQEGKAGEKKKTAAESKQVTSKPKI